MRQEKFSIAYAKGDLARNPGRRSLLAYAGDKASCVILAQNA